MAKKKKLNSETPEISEVTNTPTVTKATLPDSFSYKGEITVSIKRGNNIISKSVYKNNGGPDLFRLFAQAAAGNFKDVSRYVPKYLLLLNHSGTLADAKAKPFENIKQCSNLIQLSDADMSTTDIEADASGGNATLHFTVPKSFISSDATQINQVVLFSARHESMGIDYTTFSANYFITEVEGETEVWDPIDVSQLTENTTLIVDWKLSVVNG